MLWSHVAWYQNPTYMCSFFFFNDTATTDIYTLSLHDALPFCFRPARPRAEPRRPAVRTRPATPGSGRSSRRSEEHTSELQSQSNLVCRLLLEKQNIYLIRPHSLIPHRVSVVYTDISESRAHLH